MKAPLALLGLGGLIGAAFLLSNKKPGDIVTGKSGHSWRVVMIGVTGAVKTFEVFSPAGSFGPHGELSVLRYQQTGSDMNSRKVTAVGAGVPEAMRAAAIADFGLKVA